MIHFLDNKTFSETFLNTNIFLSRISCYGCEFDLFYVFWESLVSKKKFHLLSYQTHNFLSRQMNNAQSVGLVKISPVCSRVSITYPNNILFYKAQEVVILNSNMLCFQWEFVRLRDKNTTLIVCEYFTKDFWPWNIYF